MGHTGHRPRPIVTALPGVSGRGPGTAVVRPLQGFPRVGDCAIVPAMAASRLSEAQRQEMVARLQAGENASALAQAFGCSPNTVSRVVRAVLGDQEYERLKRQRPRRGGRAIEASQASLLSGDDAAVGSSLPADESPEDPAQPEDAAQFEEVAAGDHLGPPTPPLVETTVLDGPERDGRRDDADDRDDSDDSEPTHLALDDADDFADEDADDVEDGGEDGDGEDDDGEDDVNSASSVGALGSSAHHGGADGGAGARVADSPIQPLRPFREAPVSAEAGVYLLVDKTVELQARPLAELPELGRLPDGEAQRQALVVYVNPRQAKRHCGRNQRVIKVPDPTVFERTASYLLAQGISRLVVEGAVYTLPGS